MQNAKPPQQHPQHWRRTTHYGGDELFGHELNIYQAQTRLQILQIDTLYVVGMANEQGNFVLPHATAYSSSLIDAIVVANELLKQAGGQAARGGDADVQG